MKTDDSSVSAFAAKTHLSQLLAEAERGRSITITRRGKPVARLVPIERKKSSDVDEILARFRELRKKVAKRGRPLNIKKLVEYGRR